MRKSKTLSICFFGTYDKYYTSNRLVLQGLRENKAKILEVNAHTPVTRMDKKSDISIINLIGRILIKYRVFVEIFKHFKFIKKCDVIYVGYPGHFDVLIAYPLAKLLGKKLVFNPLLIFYTGFSEEQGILNKKSLIGKIIKRGESFIYNLCDLVFADTPYQEKYLNTDFNVSKNKLRVLPIGADSKYYKYTPYKNNLKQVNVVYYGLYSPIHGVEHIIDAALMLKEDPDIHFTMVGQGNTFLENFDKANKLGLKNITFHHHVPIETHPAIIQKADIFLGFLQKHTSVDRIIPNKIYQGLSLGRAIITADAPVIRSIFKHKINIYTCQPADPVSFAKAIVELKKDPKLRVKIAENGHKLYLNEFTPKAVGKKLINNLQNLLSQ
ncbi:hypothetical protein A3A93_00870 [Candidatus Roizmanbacteria bacterium RIFCSPLOWO2_01_FULL_38_12]|uniref:Glycosyl transferase family 1 domain-containing protein n=1 Tax=Candidatus Roizmanbacteria bacterium RIFCSPLOWO2_01_FULL_38_12 TaxID=1802061 RepID=A0A1F7IR56_9BACT|nr:MAG: hypothetical protein A3A93_00870 [Candidatus Roizmanbacteria bacterium RIFCSPLOWO2_01_FULL_38_12]